MDRKYENGEQTESIRFFMGKELERTPMYGQLTLFVVGNEFDEEIEKRLSLYPQIKHIYFAANHSYDVFTEYDQLKRFLDKGYNVTYECTADMYKHIRGLLPTVPDDSPNHFIVMLSVVIPKVHMTTKKHRIIVKVDDTDDNRTNGGVWCADIQHSIMGNRNFTDFKEYGNDTLLD